jgi:hypothetical protein
MHADPDGERSTVRRSDFSDLAQHFERGAHQLLQMVRMHFRNAGRDHVAIADGLDFLKAVAGHDAIKTRERRCRWQSQRSIDINLASDQRRAILSQLPAPLNLRQGQGLRIDVIHLAGFD